MRIGMGDIVYMILQVNICKESLTYWELGIGIVTTSSTTLYYRTFELTPVEKNLQSRCCYIAGSIPDCLTELSI